MSVMLKLQKIETKEGKTEDYLVKHGKDDT